MPRIRSVLQQRAERRRKQEENKRVILEVEKYPPQCDSKDNETEFNGLYDKPQVEPDGVSAGSIYSLEAKPTRATMAETFSSGEENTAYSEDDDHIIFTKHKRNLTFSQHDRSRLDDDGEFIDLAYESSRGNMFIDLVQEAERNKNAGIDSSQYNSYDEEEGVDQPETIQFVDSEDGKVFAITPRVGKKFCSTEEESIGNEECSKTLNTNLDSLNYLPSLSEDDSAQMDQRDLAQNQNNHNHNRFHCLQVDIGEGESYEEDDQCGGVYDNGDIHEAEEASIPQGNSELSELYDCDDGEMYFPDDNLEDQQQGGLFGPNNQVRSYDFEEEGTFFEQLRSEHTRPINDGQAQSEHWRSIKEEIHTGHPQSTHQNGAYLDTANGEQYLPDALSDRDSNSSWEEGSFGTGASRTMSRIDTAYDDDDDDGTYAGTLDGTYADTLDGTEYYSDDDNTYAETIDGDRPFVRILKKFRDMNVGGQKSGNEEVEEEGYDKTNRRTNDEQKRRGRPSRSSDNVNVFDRLGEIGIDILNETIEHAENANMSPRRRRGRNQGGTIINTFADLFSCGAPSRY
ncbi:MAG: hypothetical protein ACI8RD_011636 [Bacillariaceae sp.]|jgi:hypothetical protein